MDDLSVLPPEQSTKKPHRIRTSSLNPRQTYGQSSPATSGYTRAESPLISDGHRSSSHPEIVAPTPRRHLLDTSASQLWLHTPPLSPVSSRASPPPSAALSTRKQLPHTRSFSSLYEQNAKDGNALRKAALGRERERERQREHEDGGMGRRWINWMHRWNVKQLVVPSAIAAATLVKACIGLGSYSGEATPPMFGDYEAQRHWMELTIHLPTSQWYTYDLKYWGLDYPPLTAYVSWLCGIIAYYINPAWVALDASRGIETPESKVFMRTSVVALDALVYVPALVMFARVWQGTRSKRTQELALLTLLLQPALLLVDFGHFQYNSVMLGFALLAMNFFATGQDLIGAFFFVLSLGFKQMALYYAPAIGSYLLAKCLYLGPSQGTRLFLRLALVTLATFALLFLPFLSPSLIVHPITRIFPFARGLFEDKVANFWCASNVLLKWKSWASREFLVKLSAGLTFLGFLPSVVVLLNLGWRIGAVRKDNKNGTKDQESRKEEREHTPFLPLLPYALLTSSMSFFLFSFQVHEKTILLPLMPITLLLSGAHVDTEVYSWGVLVNNIAVFSMWPLLKRDGLGVQYIGLLLLWNRLIGYNPIKHAPKSFVQLVSIAVQGAALTLHVLELIITPPARYPDLFAVLNVLVSTPVFALVWLWSIKRGIEIAWAVGGLGVSSPRTSKKEVEEREGEKEEGNATSFRASGGRTTSLGYGQMKRRSVVLQEGRDRRSSLSTSVGGD